MKHTCEHCEKEFTEIKFNETYCSMECADKSEQEYNERIGDAWPGY